MCATLSTSCTPADKMVRNRRSETTERDSGRMPGDDEEASFQRLLGHAESEFRKRRHGSEAKRVALAERQAFEHARAGQGQVR